LFQYESTTEMLCLDFHKIGSQLANFLGALPHPSYLLFSHQSLPMHRVAAALCIAHTPLALVADCGI